MQPPFTVEDLTRTSGVDVETLHAFEQMGLLQKPRRRPGRSELVAYHQEHLERLSFIVRARRLGFPLEAIRDLLGLNGGLRTCADTYRIASRYLADARGASRPDEIATLERQLVGADGIVPAEGRRVRVPDSRGTVAPGDMKARVVLAGRLLAITLT